MKLYDFALAPNPRRVRMFLAEKGLEIPTVQINTRERGQFTEAFLRVNPGATIPVLELDDGTCISESVAICRYIEAIQPEPPLMGRDARDQALVEMWNRRAEFEGMLAIGEAARNALPLFADRGVAGVPGGVPQIPELVARGKQSFFRFLDTIDARLGEVPYLAGEAFTIADITGFVAVELGSRVEVSIPASCANVARWHRAIAARPSAQA